jgi:hypothetical protein
MSAGARITLAIVTILCAAGFAAVGILAPELPSGPWPCYGLAAFCGLIALACLARSSRPVALRIIGAVVFLGYVAFADDSIDDGNLFRAIAGLIVWGLPAGYVAIWGAYPAWGRASAAFRSERDDDDRRSGVT